MSEDIGLRLRPATEFELPLLAAILGEMDDGEPIPLDVLRARWRAMQRYPDYLCYFAEAGGTVVGTLSMIVFPVLSGAAGAEAVVESVVIRPPFRGCGYGRAMIREAIALAADKGAYKLALSSSLRREDAHRFYESLGFSRHGYSFSIDTASCHG